MPWTLELDAEDLFTGGAPNFSYQWFENGTTLIGSDQVLIFELNPDTDFIELHVTFGQPDVTCFQIIEIDVVVFEALTPVVTLDDPTNCDGEGCMSYSVPPGQVIGDDEWVITDWKGDEYDDSGGEVYCFDDDTPPGIYTVELFVENDGAVSYTHLTLPTICSV